MEGLNNSGYLTLMQTEALDLSNKPNTNAISSERKRRYSETERAIANGIAIANRNISAASDTQEPVGTQKPVDTQQAFDTQESFDQPSTSTSQIDQPGSSSAVPTNNSSDKFIDTNQQVIDVILYRVNPIPKIPVNREVALPIQDTTIRKDGKNILAHLIEIKQGISKDSPKLWTVIGNKIEESVRMFFKITKEFKIMHEYNSNDIFDIQSTLPYLFYKKDLQDSMNQDYFTANLPFILFGFWKNTYCTEIARQFNGPSGLINRFINALKQINVDEYLLLSVYYKISGVARPAFYPVSVRNSQMVIQLLPMIDIDLIIDPYITKDIKNLTDKYHKLISENKMLSIKL